MREKRPLENDGNDEARPEEKRQKAPQLASVIVEALKVDSLQKLCSSLEPILRRVVSEEVERALAKLAPAKLANRASPKRIEGPDGRNLKLHFKSRLSLPLFTGAKVEGEQGAAIHVVLLDADTSRVVTSGPEASAKLDITVLEGDFNNEDEEDWTQEEFESHEVKEREGKRPLLTGELQVTLKEGVGTIGELIFTDNSSWIRSRKFRLGLKVASGYCEGIRIREAKTEAFTVKDHRGELYKKHYPPALNDEVWRLNKIGKDGAFHKKLNKAGIITVEDFLRLVVTDPQRLRNTLGSGMSNKMWESTIEHAKTCVLSGKLYVYYTDETQNVGVIFNNVYELSGLIANQQYYPAESLSDNEKVTVDAWVKKAYDNWMSVVEYDGKALVNRKSNKKGSSSCQEASIPTIQYANTYNQQASLSSEMVGMQAAQASANAELTGGVSTNSGYSERSVAKYAGQPLQMTTTNQLPYGTLSYNPPNQVTLPGLPHQNALSSPDSLVGLALGPPQSTVSTVSTVVPYHSMGTVMQLGSTNGEDWSHTRDNRGQVDDYFSEEDIRSRSLEMLENEDMQHLLRMFSIGAGGVSVPDDSYQYAAFTPAPNYGLNEDRTRGSGKAVVGWLKLKAALRWGIFIRKIAAEKRAHLEELD